MTGQIYPELATQASTLDKDEQAGLVRVDGRAYVRRLDAGHGDAFNAFVDDADAAIRTGAAPGGLPTFHDGLRAARITEAVLASARSRAWEEVPR